LTSSSKRAVPAIFKAGIPYDTTSAIAPSRRPVIGAAAGGSS
jgi:hypothetical protein